ncbi:MAG: pirin family protein [Anaerolineae bacterium]|nr:pirin family protein [Gloeobacterales cyanobacterium ES-bin-313]
MITLRTSEERGHANHGWLDSYHTFSFANYYDPMHMGFRALRVINEDRVAPGQGFGTHSHRDMEIITYVLEGSLEHKDSIGNGSVIRHGVIQRMSAGTGIAHSEFNPSSTEPVHLLQIWIMPAVNGIVPSYEEKSFDLDEQQGKLRLIVSPEGREGSLSIHQDLDLYAATLKAGEVVTHALRPNRHAWMQVAQGSVDLDGKVLTAGDGAAVSSTEQLSLNAIQDAEILLFDLA